MGEPRSRKLVLASSSPRRREILSQSGYVFEVQFPNIPEDLAPGEEPRAFAERLARAKARTVADGLDAEVCVLAADTVVVVDERIYGKPAHEEEAIDMLCSLAGRVHRVLTAYCVRAGSPGSSEEYGCAESQVHMRPVERAEAQAYAASGEPLDKAGAYAVQGEGSRFITRIDGLRSNVIGLPIEQLAPLLARFGVHPQ